MISKAIAFCLYYKFFKGSNMVGKVDKTFIRKINGTTIFLVATVLYHALSQYSSRVFAQTNQFTFGCYNGKCQSISNESGQNHG